MQAFVLLLALLFGSFAIIVDESKLAALFVGWAVAMCLAMQSPRQRRWRE